MAAIKVQGAIIRKARVAVNTSEITVSAGNSERFRPRVRQTEEEPLREAAVDGDLKRIVIRARSLAVDRNVAEARVRAEEVPVEGAGPEQRTGVLGRILILRQERCPVRDRVQVELIQQMPALRPDVGRIEHELPWQFRLDTEVVIHHHRKFAVVVQAQQAAGAEQRISGIDLADKSVDQRRLERGGWIGQLVEDLITLEAIVEDAEPAANDEILLPGHV